MIATAQTGTGKTAAFGLPLLQLTDVFNKSVQGIILCPTRELCLQIGKDLSSFSKYLKGVTVLSVYGGEKIEKQIKNLKKTPQIIVGTPGRTKDLIKRKKLFLGNVKRLILDESDEMLSMGFKEDLEFILSSTSIDKQILLFSATMTKKVNEVCSDNAKKVGIKLLKRDPLPIYKFDKVLSDIQESKPLDPITVKRFKETKFYEVIQNIKQGGRSSYFCKKCQR